MVNKTLYGMPLGRERHFVQLVSSASSWPWGLAVSVSMESCPPQLLSNNSVQVDLWEYHVFTRLISFPFHLSPVWLKCEMSFEMKPSLFHIYIKKKFHTKFNTNLLTNLLIIFVLPFSGILLTVLSVLFLITVSAPRVDSNCFGSIMFSLGSLSWRSITIIV